MKTKTIPNTPFQRWLDAHDACEEGRTWVGRRTPQQMWHDCRRPEWMWWLLHHLEEDDLVRRDTWHAGLRIRDDGPAACTQYRQLLPRLPAFLPTSRKRATSTRRRRKARLTHGVVAGR